MLQAKLFVLDKEIILIHTDMSYSRSIDHGRGVPSRVVGGKIRLAFETLEDSYDLMHWITRASGGMDVSEKSKMEKGKICFYDQGFENAPAKTYEFNDAYLVYYREYFNRTSEYPMMTMMTISPAIQDYGVEHIESWNISHLAPAVQLPYQPMEVVEKRPKITAIYFEDMDGKRIKELVIGSEVYIVVESEYVAGKTVNINLSDKDHDFLFNGELLEDDILRDITISGDVHKEKLKVVADHTDSPEEDESTPDQTDQKGSQEETTSAPLETEKILTEYFLTDKSGKKVEEYEVGDTIILNIKTKNRIGDKLTIHLEEKTHSFKYKGEALKDDKLTDFIITKDEEKIELEVSVQTAKKG